MEWQMYWRHWGLCWKRFPYEEFDCVDHVVVIGPLQMRWRR